MMELVNYEHSTKDIPVPSEKVYLNMMINSIETLDHKVSWEAKIFLDKSKATKKNTYGFPSLNSADKMEECVQFRQDLVDMVKNIKFKERHSAFQSKLKSEIATIKNEGKLIVSADKTSNHFKMDVPDYNKLVEKEVNKDYMISPASHVSKINASHKSIVRKLEIQDRVFRNTEREAFITLKDHKPGFANNPKSRLLNPFKVEMGKISHQKLKSVINVIRQKTQLNQWANTYECIEWFKSIKDKEKHSFLVLDIVSFYPSITDNLLSKALDWAEQFVSLSSEDRNIFFEARKSMLVFDGKVWTKKNNPDFDVAMGAYDGAEVCDICGLYILAQIQKLKLNANIGGYKDDFLGVSRSSPRQIEMMKKKICQLFQSLGLDITAEANKRIVQYLDVEFNLVEGSFKPYLKEGDTPLYVNSGSNHPPLILKNIPASINRRLSALSSDEAKFNSVKPIYQDALHKAGYDYQLHYDPPPPTGDKKGRKRSRKIIWWNPPFSLNVKTRVGQKFFEILEKNFPIGSRFRKIFNRNTMKMSYRTTPNMKQLISSNNKKVLHPVETRLPCNCHKSKVCPMERNGDCRLECVVYKATVTPSDPLLPVETYTGMTEPTFKKRFRNHEKAFNNRDYETDSALSKHIWKLKDKNVGYNIEWQVLDRAPGYSPVTKVCKLCTLEKYYIVFHSESASLNQHEEWFKPCPHRRPKLLENT